MLRTQDFIAPVGGGLTVQIKANYIKYLNGSAGGLSARIRVRTELGGVDVTMEPGDSVRLPTAAAQFTVANADGEATIAGVLIAGVGEFETNRIIGTVGVVDSAKSLTLAERTYVATMFLAPGAGFAGAAQLWNPASNTRRVVLNGFKVWANYQASYEIWATNAAFASGYGVPPNARRKLLSGSGSMVSTAETRKNENAAAWFGTARMVEGMVGANTETGWQRLAEPIVIYPGWGVVAKALTYTGSMFGAGFDFYEEPLS